MLHRRGAWLSARARVFVVRVVRYAAWWVMWVDRAAPTEWAGEPWARELAKLGAIGVRLSRWITMHGFALNVLESSLPAFAHITPCGIAGVEMTCLERESRPPVSLPEVAARAAETFPAPV